MTDTQERWSGEEPPMPHYEPGVDCYCIPPVVAWPPGTTNNDGTIRARDERTLEWRIIASTEGHEAHADMIAESLDRRLRSEGERWGQ